jgi:hypothetical protein
MSKSTKNAAANLMKKMKSGGGGGGGEKSAAGGSETAVPPLKLGKMPTKAQITSMMKQMLQNNPQLMQEVQSQAAKNNVPPVSVDSLADQMQRVAMSSAYNLAASNKFGAASNAAASSSSTFSSSTNATGKPVVDKKEAMERLNTFPTSVEGVRQHLNVGSGGMVIKAFNDSLYAFVEKLIKAFPGEVPLVTGLNMIETIRLGDPSKKEKDDKKDFLVNQWAEYMLPFQDVFVSFTPENVKRFLEQVSEKIQIMRQLKIHELWESMDEDEQKGVFNDIHQLNQMCSMCKGLSSTSLADMEGLAVEYLNEHREDLAEAALEQDITKVPFLQITAEVYQKVQNHPALSQMLQGDSSAGLAENPFLSSMLKTAGGADLPIFADDSADGNPSDAAPTLNATGDQEQSFSFEPQATGQLDEHGQGTLF